MKRLLLLSLLLIIPLVSAEVVINEIMYNPDAGSSFDKEYVEIFLDPYVNLSEYTIEDIESNDNLTQVKFVDSSYALIVGNGFDYSDINSTVYVCEDSAKIGSGLNNDGDVIILRDASNYIIDVVNYYEDWADQNHSTERVAVTDYSGDPDNWEESIEGGTPGEQNSVYGCDWTISIILNETISKDPDFRIRVSKIRGDEKIEFTVDKWIEFSNGTISRTYSPWNDKATSKKTSNWYSPNLAEGDAYIIKANITEITCNDKNISNNFISEMIFVPEEKIGIDPNSSIQILDSPSTAEFGDLVKVKINVYRGDVRKYAVYAYIEEEDGTDVSEKSTMHFRDKYTNYTLTVPVQLKFNCNSYYDEDDYVLVVEGLNLKAEEKIELSGKSAECKKDSSTSTTESEAEENKILKILDYPTSVKVQEPFEIKAKIENQEDKTKIYDIYSYIYKGTSCVSEGFLDEWESGWTANKQTVTIEPKSTAAFILRNRIEAGAESGTYRLRVRAKEGIKSIDVTEDIIIQKEVYTGSGDFPSASQITGGTVYVSESSNRARSIVYLILLISIILNIIFIRASR